MHCAYMLKSHALWVRLVLYQGVWSGRATCCQDNELFVKGLFNLNTFDIKICTHLVHAAHCAPLGNDLGPFIERSVFIVSYKRN